MSLNILPHTKDSEVKDGRKYIYEIITLHFKYFAILSITSQSHCAVVLKISEFPTSRLEMSAVADIFDRDGDGYIDYYEFVAALHPNKDAYKPVTDADKIEDEVLVIFPLPTPTTLRCVLARTSCTTHAALLFSCLAGVEVLRILCVILTLKWVCHHCFWQVTRQVAKCKCAKRFQVEQIGDNKYRVSFQNNFVVLLN